MDNTFDENNEKFIADAKHCYEHMAKDIVTPQTHELATKIHEALCSGEYSNGVILAALAAATGFVLSESRDRGFAYAESAAFAAAVRNIFDKVEEAKKAAEAPKPDQMGKLYVTRRPGTN